MKKQTITEHMESLSEIYDIDLDTVCKIYNTTGFPSEFYDELEKYSNEQIKKTRQTKKQKT